MDFKENSVETLDSCNDTTNHLIDYDIVKEEYVIEEASAVVEERTLDDQNEFVKFEIREVELESIKNQGHKCFICEKTFRPAYRLKRHMLSHSSRRDLHCALCSKSFKTRQSIIRHVRTHIKNPVPCHICKRTVKNPWALQIHLRLHQSKTILTCQFCGKVFKTERLFKAHIKCLDSDRLIEKKPLICSVCGKFFKKQFNFDKHVAYAHEANRHQCKICLWTFSRNMNLVSHMSTHKRKKPFACDICNKKFRLKKNLSSHNKTHNAVKEEPVSCNYCSNKTFKKTSSLHSHMHCHHRGLPRNPGNSPACTICRQAFQDLDDLKKHVAIHPVLNHYECAICGMKTKLRYTFVQHMNTEHLKMLKRPNDRKTKREPCPICSKEYLSRNLKNHIKTHK